MAWIVAVHMDFYPCVIPFETYEEAKAEYEKQVKIKYYHDKVYLAEVKESV